MSTDLPPELEPDALAAVRDARRIVEPPSDVRARMRARLLANLPPRPDGDGGDDGGGSPGEPPPQAPSSAMPKVPLWTVAAALAVGLSGGLLYPRAPEVRVVTVVAQPSAITPVASIPPAAAPSSTLPSIALRDLPSAVPSVAPPAGSYASPGAALEAERAMLDVARTALGRGDGAHALTACDDHARRFPRGVLAEEREAIAVQALLLAHRSDDAQARAERFQKSYPRSIFLPAVLAAVGIDQP